MPRATTIKKRGQKRFKPAGTDSHKKVRKSCKKCPIEHTVNEDRFHGQGSFEETHVGYCKLNCCGSQEDSPYYNPKTRAQQVKMKRARMKTKRKK